MFVISCQCDDCLGHTIGQAHWADAHLKLDVNPETPESCEDPVVSTQFFPPPFAVIQTELDSQIDPL